MHVYKQRLISPICKVGQKLLEKYIEKRLISYLSISAQILLNSNAPGEIQENIFGGFVTLGVML